MHTKIYTLTCIKADKSITFYNSSRPASTNTYSIPKAKWMKCEYIYESILHKSFGKCAPQLKLFSNGERSRCFHNLQIHHTHTYTYVHKHKSQQQRRATKRERVLFNACCKLNYRFLKTNNEQCVLLVTYIHTYKVCVNQCKHIVFALFCFLVLRVSYNFRR